MAIPQARHLKKLSQIDTRWLGVAAVALLAGLILWANHLYDDPQRVFWSMIANNLSTPSVTKTTNSDSGASNLSTDTRTIFGPDLRVHDLRRYIDASGGPITRISQESVATPTDIYQRFTLIDQPGLLGDKKPDYSELYKLWLKNGGGGENNNAAFTVGLFDTILFGNFSPAKRGELVNFIKSHKVYTVEYQKAQKKDGNISYDVKVDLHEHTAAAKLYAQLLGLPRAMWPNPDSYAAGSTKDIKISVSAMSRQLKELSDPEGLMKQQYNGYGINTDISVPKHVVSIQEFQAALKAANR